MKRGALLGTVMALALLCEPAPAAGQWLDLAVPQRPPADSASRAAGMALYDQWCWFCHGEQGRGDGPVAAYLWPRPRDFYNAVYKLRTTASGELPLDEDLYRTISLGIPGTSMPAWDGILSPEERWQVIDYVKSFAADLFEDETFDPYQAIVDVPAPPDEPVASSVAAGLDAYVAAECDACHGLEGRGYGPRADSITDDQEWPILPADLRSSWKYKGGSGVEEVYLRLSSGMSGTPMPSYSKTLTETERWRIARYVASLQDGPPENPGGRTVIPARALEGGVPTEPDDARWASAAPISIPLTGQGTFPPRWQIPSVTDLEVRAVHDGDALALRLSWNDPLPDTLPPDTVLARRLGWQADDTWPELAPEQRRVRARFPDAAEVVVPSGYAGGLTLPHFVYGSAERPVELWQWRGDRGSRRRARQPGSSAAVPPTRRRAAGVEAPPMPVEAGGSAASSARWAEGRWSVVLRWPLTGDGAEGAFATAATWRIEPGRQLPIAFHVWDGANGETGLRMALSSWYTLYLEQPADPVAYALVLLVVLGVAAAEWGLVRWMRLRADSGALARYGVLPRRG